MSQYGFIFPILGVKINKYLKPPPRYCLKHVLVIIQKEKGKHQSINQWSFGAKILAAVWEVGKYPEFQLWTSCAQATSN